MKNKNIKAALITAAIIAPMVWGIFHPVIGAKILVGILLLLLCYLIWCLVYAILDQGMP